MPAPFLVFDALSEWSFFLTISSAQILHIIVHNVTLRIMMCWSKKDVEVSWHNKTCSTLQGIVHSPSTFQLQSFKSSLIDPLGLTKEKINSFLWPFCSFSSAGCSAWLRNRDNRASGWVCLIPPPFSKQFSSAGHTRIIIKVTFAVRLRGPWGYPAAMSAGMRSQLMHLDTFRINDSETIKGSWNMSGFYEGERSNTHFPPRLGRIRTNQGNVKEIIYQKAENTFCENNRCSTTYSPNLKTGSF